VTAGSPTPHRPDLLDPTLDVVFKLLMTRQPRLLQHMLEGILRRSIGSLRLVDATLPGEHAHGKGIVVDVRCVLDDGARITLEMQRRGTEALRLRLLFYWARGFTDQLSWGEDYDQLRPTVVIAWLPGRSTTIRLVRSTYDLHPELVEPDYAAAFLHLGRELRQRTLVVVLTRVADDVSAEALARCARGLLPRHLPLIVLLRDPDVEAMALVREDDDEAALYRRAAAADFGCPRHFRDDQRCLHDHLANTKVVKA